MTNRKNIASDKQEDLPHRHYKGTYTCDIEEGSYTFYMNSSVVTGLMVAFLILRATIKDLLQEFIEL